MDAGHHDLVLAMTSHVPHLIAYNIVGTAHDLEKVTETEVIKFSAGGFRDFTRIAASDPIMWRDVFLNNREAVLEVLGRFNEDLSLLQRAVRDGNGQCCSIYSPAPAPSAARSSISARIRRSRISGVAGATASKSESMQKACDRFCEWRRRRSLNNWAYPRPAPEAPIEQSGASAPGAARPEKVQASVERKQQRAQARLQLRPRGLRRHGAGSDIGLGGVDLAAVDAARPSARPCNRSCPPKGARKPAPG